MEKLTTRLHWTSLKEEFFIGMRAVEELQRDAAGKLVLVNGEPVTIKTSRLVNELQSAIDAGTIDQLVEECATTMHAGNVQAVLAAWAKTLDSMKCNMAKKAYSPTATTDKVRLETLQKYIASKRTSTRAVSNTGLPQWAYGPTEIDQIDDPAKLQKIINSINDVCSGKANSSHVRFLGENYVAAAKVNRAYAQARKAKLEADAAKPDQSLLDALASVKGKHVRLTAEQAAMLTKLLQG